MSTIKKTIIVNPELFKFTSGGKTKKNKDTQIKPLPVVSPNHLKMKLLNRIKQHKNNEINELKQKKTDVQNDKYTDEFYDAIGYLSDLSNKHKSEANLHNKTLKTNYNPNPSNFTPYVQLDLPPELQEPIMHNYNPVLHPMKINYKVDNVVPHGCLRGGQKPTYRTWQKTQKQYPSINHPIPIKQQAYDPAPNLSREDRLSMIKKKLQHLETKQTYNQKQSISIQTDVSSPIQIQPSIILDDNINMSHVPSEIARVPVSSPQPIIPLVKPLNVSVVKEPPLTDTIPSNNDTLPKLPRGKKYVKTTIRRKYTLGKSNLYRKVGVLIKDKNTRKNVLNAHKELKRTPMNEIKKYLHKHGIMKVGSTAPNDVLKQTYECSRLAGEINNTNKDILLHNFMKEPEL